MTLMEVFKEQTSESFLHKNTPEVDAMQWFLKTPYLLQNLVGKL